MKIPEEFAFDTIRLVCCFFTILQDEQLIGCAVGACGGGVDKTISEDKIGLHMRKRSSKNNTEFELVPAVAACLISLLAFCVLCAFSVLVVALAHDMVAYFSTGFNIAR